MFRDIMTIRDWMVLKYNPNMYKSKSDHNIARLCLKKHVLTKITIPLLIEELKNAGIPEEDICSSTKTFIQFALPFSKTVPLFWDRLTVFMYKLREHMEKRFEPLLKKDNNLQSLIIDMLNNREFRLKSSVYYASKHGHKATFDLLDTINNVWS